jgi:hypothetical protein
MARRLTDEERMMMAMQQAMSNPFAAPITLESQVNDQLEQLDMSKLPSAAQTDAWGKRDTARRAASSVGPQTERLKQQQAYANMLRSSKLPGIERVGPSNIAVRNPWDAAETAFNRAYGGYLSGKLGEDYENLSQAESDKAEAELEYQDILKQEDRGFQAGESALTRASQEQRAAERLAFDKQKQAEDLALSREQIEDKARKDRIKQEHEILDEAATDINETMVDRRERARDIMDESREQLRDARSEELKAELKGPELTTKQKNDLADLEGVQEQLADFRNQMELLPEDKKDEFGNWITLMAEVVPDPVRNWVESGLSRDVQNLRARAAYVDNYMREAVTSGVLSNQDVSNLKPMALSGTPSYEQIMGRVGELEELIGQKALALSQGRSYTPPKGDYNWSDPYGQKYTGGGRSKKASRQRDDDPLGLR